MCLGLGQSQQEFQANPNGEFHVDVFKVLPPSSNVSHSRIQNLSSNISHSRMSVDPTILIMHHFRVFSTESRGDARERACYFN